jgi:GTPase SAR1 family protein
MLATRIKSSHAIILAFDLTNEDSFNQLKDEFLKIADENAKERLKFIVGCKGDLKEKITVKQEKYNVNINYYIRK